MSIDSQFIVPVILCGGTGSRLWPLSRTHYPKQFLTLDGSDKSLLQDTITRIVGKEFATPVLVTNQEHRFLVAEHIRALNVECDILLEPVGRNTAPAITAAALHIQQKHPHALMLVLPSDHVIKNSVSFLAAVQEAKIAAQQGHLVTFGITPEYPETGYGYIKKGASLEQSSAFAVEAFVEKPDLETAEHYINSGAYAWNSGMFLFPVTRLLEEIDHYEPDILRHVSHALEKSSRELDFIRLAKEPFLEANSISIDYAIMERTKHAAIVPVECLWSDAGAWDALWRIGEKDAEGNVSNGTVLARASHNNYFRADSGQAIAALGLEDMIVVATPDMVLVANQSHAQDVKKMMEEASIKNKNWVDHHTRVYRPWGFYETIRLNDRHQVKHICVHSGARISVQMHHHRAEHWVVVGGTGKVTVDGVERILTENDYVHIPLASVHCIENIGRVPLEFIEVQYGGYLGEDDIVRFDDRYGRADPV